MAQGQRASELGQAAPGRHRALGSNTNKPPPATGSGSPVVLLTLANCKTRTSAGPMSSRDSLHPREEDGVAWVGLGSAGWGRGRLPAYAWHWGPLFPADATDRPRSGPGHFTKVGLGVPHWTCRPEASQGRALSFSLVSQRKALEKGIPAQGSSPCRSLGSLHRAGQLV